VPEIMDVCSARTVFQARFLAAESNKIAQKELASCCIWSGTAPWEGAAPLPETGPAGLSAWAGLRRCSGRRHLTPKVVSVKNVQYQLPPRSPTLLQFNPHDRRTFIGGSDARIIMGSDDAAMIRLWREKRGEIEAEDLSENLVLQLGTVTEELNRRWYERQTGQAVKHVQKRLQHPVHKWMAATLDGLVIGSRL
jgi:hypothetical protein